MTTSLISKVGWMLTGVLALYALSALAGVARGGELDPPGLPGPTMKSLADVAPSWHQTLPSNDGEPDGCNSTRFTCVMGSAGLLDNETGLVWQRSPALATLHSDWWAAWYACANANIGGRQAWRLPTIEELATLRDDSPDHTPDGAPMPPSTQLFWSSSQDFADSNFVNVFKLNSASFNGELKNTSPEPGFAAWCVRGPQSSGYTGSPP